MSLEVPTTVLEKKESEKHILISRNGNQVTIQEREAGVYEVVDSNVFNDEIQEVGFSGWDEEVENLDTDSDVFQSFGDSEHLRWKEVELTPGLFKGPSIDKVKEAFFHVDIETSSKREV